MDAKDIQNLMKLCRKYGVTAFNTPNLSMKFGDMPKGKEEEQTETETPDAISPDDLMYFSAGGAP